ncbi:MAG: peptide chain release factor 1 [Holosporaceae bacterium]
MGFQQTFKKRLDAILVRFAELQKVLESEPAPAPTDLAKLLKEQSDLVPIVDAIEALNRLDKELLDLEALKEDAAMRDLAFEESALLKDRLQKQEAQLKKLLLPKDRADSKNVMVEIRQGTGGDEAALFARDLWQMYVRYAEQNKWTTHLLSLNTNDLGGVKEVIFGIKGNNVFSKLKFESGVHRVQRVPATEGAGRVHTSAATVAVLPEAEEVDVVLRDEDLRIDTFRASGAGGQHVNKTESAIRITHIPSGLVVQQQDEKSQHKNKARAMKILRARLYAQERAKEEAKRSDVRKSQVGSGDRSERIRTYNYPQGRVSDHRINLTLHQLPDIMAGALDPLIENLIAHDESLKLTQLESAD